MKDNIVKVKILKALRCGEKHYLDIAKEIGVDPKIVSMHLSKMKAVGMVKRPQVVKKVIVEKVGVYQLCSSTTLETTQ